MTFIRQLPALSPRVEQHLCLELIAPNLWDEDAIRREVTGSLRVGRARSADITSNQIWRHTSSQCRSSAPALQEGNVLLSLHPLHTGQEQAPYLIAAHDLLQHNGGLHLVALVARPRSYCSAVCTRMETELHLRQVRAH